MKLFIFSCLDIHSRWLRVDTGVSQHRYTRPTGWRVPIIDHCRSSRSQMFFAIGVLKTFHNIHRKAPVLESLFNKVAGLKACNFIERDSNIDVSL